MKREDIEHLAKLSRIALSEAEVTEFATEISEILGYVSEINEITGSNAGEKKVGVLYNVMREDGTPNEADSFTEALLAAAPARKGRFVEVKKIIGDKA